MISLPHRTAIGLNLQHNIHSCNDSIDYMEGPSRIESIITHLKQSGIWDQCNVIQEHFPIDEGDLKETHDKNYVRCIAELKNKSQKAVDELANEFDSVYLCQGTYEAACGAVACARNMAALIAERKIPNGFALIRPPGHHAQRNAANGFCVFNNVAQAAEEAYNFGEDRILIIDFDVHHGQGVQQSFYEEKRVMYCSIHRYDNGKFWPHLAESNFDHIGSSSGVGYNVNVPLNELGCGDADYMAIFWNILWPLASTYRPHFVIVAAGYDACQGDPIGGMDVSPDLFAHFVYHLKGLAGGKILLCLEGGCNEKNVALCVERCIRILLGEAPNPLPKLPSPKRSTVVSCLNVISMLLPHWQQCFGFYAVDGTLHAGWEIHHPKRAFCASAQRKGVNTQHINQSTLPRISGETIPDEIGHVTAIAYDPRVELHREETDMAHVERPERTSVIAKRLRGAGLLRRCVMLPPREATYDELQLVHQLAHIKHMESIAEVDESERRREEDESNSIYFCRESFRASIAAVGSILECVDAVFDEERKDRARNAFALIRPPGHHATPSQPAGFCIFNNVAIAAKYAMEKYGLERILIVDWDIHHGNGIQEIFYSDPRVLYISLHRHDDGLFYPANEPKDVKDAGEGAGLGYSINIPFSHGRMSDNDYRMAFNKIVMPIAYEYSPQLVIISSGFDAAYGDILGGYELSAQCYAQLTYQLCALAKGRLIVALEGGYSLTVLQDCAEAVVRTLLDRCLPLVSPVPLSCTKASRTVVRRSAWDTIRRVCLHQSQYWACLNGLQMKLVKGVLELPEVSPEPEVLLLRAKLRDEAESDKTTPASESLLPSTDKTTNK